MPRATQHPFIPILKFFKTADVPTCKLAQALIAEEIKERETVLTLIPAATSAAPARRGPKPGFKRKKPLNEATPLVSSVGGES